MKQSFEVRASLPDLNKIIAESKIYWGKYAKSKKGYDMIVAAFAKRLKPVRSYPVEIHCCWRTADRRKDPDNIAAGIKFILDGLVKAGILRGDGFSEVSKITHEFTVDKSNIGVEVTLR